ncbi:efflux RND transporter permease subunit [Salisediminibacterium selenitireducens]|uniref:Acriflavin resistance protein n=1 Tax=Bacillus selenitireducens (strain ATCC 700615 / DSM 15326 / MLS10) TaxID=439292 RepID=D6XXS5_BACIE|nr:efflux RND transporter permease subunit [Salisediminibacterium selenitireducens]ADI00118.1 acriflavin resistance protein [[Bacillus] selenitireducens MLS10]
MKMMNGLLNRKIMVVLFSALILIFGFMGANRLDRELFPDLDFDLIMVSIAAGDMPVSDVERLITDPFEDTLLRTDAVKDFQSTTSSGAAMFYMETASGETREAVRELEGAADALMASVPEIVFADVMAMSTNQEYEFFMAISEGSMADMTRFGRIVEERLEGLSEVKDVRLNGTEESHIELVFDYEAMLGYGLHLTEAIRQIQEADVTLSVAEVDGSQSTVPVRWDTSFQSVSDIERLMLRSGGGPLALTEVATVEEASSRESAMAWLNGDRDFIFVEIGREEDATQLEMAEAVRGEIQDLMPLTYSYGVTFEEVVNQADYVSAAIGDVTQNILIGGLLALGVLLVFLRNVRAMLIVSVTIPLSILLTFASMWILDYSINMLTLIGLGLGIGMMVDASIVILESIYRKKEQGLAGREAVMTGLKEVTSAVLASMLTTVVVFLPVGLFGGDFAVFILILSVVVVITLVSSVLVSFTLIPSLSEAFLKLKGKSRDQDIPPEGRTIHKYGSLIGKLTEKKRRRYGVIMLFTLVFVSSLLLTTRIPSTIMPDVMDRYAEIGISLESGLTTSEREAVVEAVQGKLEQIDDIESVIVIDGVDYLFTLINMTKDDEETVPQADVNLAISEALASLEEDHPVTGSGMVMGPGQASPVTLFIKGDDNEQMKQLQERVARDLEDVTGIANIAESNRLEQEERQFLFHEARITEAGLTKGDVLGQIQAASAVIPVGTIRESGLDQDVLARSNAAMTTEDELSELMILGYDGTPYPLGDFASLETVYAPGEISRANGERYVTVTADIEGRDLGAVNRDVQEMIGSLTVPDGITVEAGGDLEAQQEMIMDFLLIIGISIVLVYMVMAVQFNSFIQPFIVMTVIPLTATGSILALFLTQRELSILSALGILMLIGIVLNNAILLIDRINQLRRSGMPVKEAVVEASKNRIRPIFMTTLTTVGGMLPLALATGAAGGFHAPLATVMIGGLLFAPLITLVLIPSVYLTVEDVLGLFRRRNKREERSASNTEEVAS